MITLYTIGHSKHTIGKLVELLQGNGVTTLVDVRTSPYSRFCPWFNKDDLEFELPRRQIEYTFAGKHLGGRPSEASLYKNRVIPEEETDYLHEVDYPEIMKRPWFEQAIQRLLETAEQSKTAIMCSEENPADCHRHHLIARYLIENYPDEVEVIHIRGDGVVFNARSIHKSVDQPHATQGKLF